MATPTNLERVWEIFEGALVLPEDQRSAWLDEKCAGDEGLRGEISRLLKAHGKTDGVLDATLGEIATQAFADSQAAFSNERVGPYRVLVEIGRGGMAVVYKAEDPRLGRYVALKFISPNLVANEQARQRLMSEARAASRLDHPNICTIYDIGETPDGRIYLAMAYYDGQTLADRLLKGPLPADEAMAITVQIARALDHAHEAGVVHRDIKPSNVMLTSRGEVKVLDFGLAKHGGISITESGARLGTVHYASPEQARGKQVDSRTDLWSLGATLYEMLTGRTPFPGEEAMGVLYKIVHEQPPPIGAGVPLGVVRIVQKLLSKKLDDRYVNARDLLQ
ncbi:MAG: serine/threonine protein kinase, partial [bacterium]|nr:serine/threonine protein kinase [bacterium]